MTERLEYSGATEDDYSYDAKLRRAEQRLAEFRDESVIPQPDTDPME